MRIAGEVVRSGIILMMGCVVIGAGVLVLFSG